MNQYEVLIIDDEAGIREVLAEFSTLAGFRVKTAENVGVALGILQEFPVPPLIICDISMPGKSGLDFLERVREKSLPCAVAMLTGHSDSTRVIEALRLGAIDYVCKPFDVQKLINNLHNWLELGKSLQAIHNSKSEDQKNLATQLRVMELYRLKIKNSAERVS